MNNKITKKYIHRSEFLPKFARVANDVAEKIGSTMTSNGDFFSLSPASGGGTTNDGATIVEDFVNGYYDVIGRDYIDRLRQATFRTDEFAGDGTSATTVITGRLVEAVDRIYLQNPALGTNALLTILDRAKKFLLEYLEKNKYPLKTKEDFVNLATVSTKDENWGKMIGEAFFEAGATSSVMIRPNKVNSYDEIVVENEFMIPVFLGDSHGMPRQLQDANVFVVNSELERPCPLLQRILEHTYTSGKNSIIIAKGVGVLAANYITDSNKLQSEKTGAQAVIIPFGKVDGKDESDEIIKDLASYFGATELAYNDFDEKIDVAKAGTAELYWYDAKIKGQEYAKFTSKSKTTQDERKKHIKKEIEGKDPRAQAEEIKRLKSRYNRLDGKTIWFNIYADSDEEMKTKYLRIQDAVKSTYNSIDKGFVAGSGLWYLMAGREMYDMISKEDRWNNVWFELASAMASINHMIEKKKFASMPDEMHDRGASTIIESTAEKNIGIIFDRNNGKYHYGDVLKEGIIDSAAVVENVIRNSFSIAMNIATITWYSIDIEPEEELVKMKSNTGPDMVLG